MLTLLCQNMAETQTAATQSVVEVEFRIGDPAYPFVGGSRAADCRIELQRMIARRSGTYAEFFEVAGADPDRVAALAVDHGSVDVTVLRDGEQQGLLEFVVSDDCPAHSLAERGALPQRVEAEDGTGRIVADVPVQYDASAVVEGFLSDVPEADFVAKREKEAVGPVFSPSTVRRALAERLTDRQREVLEAAFEAGYYDWPRSCTAEEVAAGLDISSPTFCEHVNAAERKLLGLLFDRADGDL